jgi:hypothetical protein
MRTFALGRFALSTSVAATLLAACGGSQPPIGAPGAMPQATALAAHAGRGKSWMLPEAKGETLIYLSSGQSSVYVFGYHSGNLLGTITGFYAASGLCVDKHGDVFVTDNEKGEVFEFAHGKDSVKKTYPDSGYAPSGCAVDLANGDLAVANYCRGSSSGDCVSDGDVVIFDHARGKPRVYSASSMSEYQACTYDNVGNLYVSGRASHPGGSGFARLSASRKLFDAISLDQSFGSYVALQWVGTQLTVGNNISRVIVQFNIKGRRGISTGATSIPGAYFAQYWVTGNKVVVPGLGQNRHSYYNHWIYYFDYPSGGVRVKKARTPEYGYGITVSIAR